VIGDDTVRPMADQPAATAGGPGPEPCRDCRAPLVPGQRYCLYCGARVPEARLEFLDVLVQDVAGVGPAPAVPAATAAAAAAALGSARREPGVNGWLRQHTPVLGLTGLILGTLLIGLLIGHWATDGSSGDAPARAAAQPVITVQSAAPAAATTAAGDGAAATTGAGSGAAADGGSAGASAKSSKHGASGSSGKAAAKKTTAKAPANAVSTKALSNLSGQDKEKAIEKAAKNGQPIATGNGKLPPTDEKAPAGGAGFETIG
jgi:hypothetical protein